MTPAEELAASRARIFAAIAEHNALVASTQSTCKHERVAECEYCGETAFSNVQPPRRACEICGLMEDGWGSGYKILTTPYVRRVSRDQLYRMRQDFPPLS